MSKKQGKTLKDGSFQTRCLNCGAKVVFATEREPPMNCSECPDHDDISRRDQEVADKDRKKSEREQTTGEREVKTKLVPIYDDESVRLPSLPNFLERISRGDSHVMPIHFFTKVELRKIARVWTEELLKKGMKQKSRDGSER